MSIDEATCGAVPSLTIRAQAGRNGPCVLAPGHPGWHRDAIDGEAMDWANTADRDGVLMGAAMTPATQAAHDQAVDPTAPSLSHLDPAALKALERVGRSAEQAAEVERSRVAAFSTYALTAEQEIRARALDYATRLTFDPDEGEPVADALDIADRFGAYVATGDKPGVVAEHVVWAVVAGTWNSNKVMALYGTEEAAEAHVHDRAGEVDDGLSVKAWRVLDNPAITRPATVDREERP